MKKLSITLYGVFTLTFLFCQPQHNAAVYLSTQFNQTIYDNTVHANPWALGFGLQTFFFNKSKFAPIIDITSDLYLENDRVYRTNPDGSEKTALEGMTNLFVGTSFYFTDKLYLSMVAGPSFNTGKTLFGVKPSIGYHFSKNKKWMAKASLINIYNRDALTKDDFGALSLAIAFKLF